MIRFLQKLWCNVGRGVKFFNLISTKLIQGVLTTLKVFKSWRFKRQSNQGIMGCVSASFPDVSLEICPQTTAQTSFSIPWSPTLLYQSLTFRTRLCLGPKCETKRLRRRQGCVWYVCKYGRNGCATDWTEMRRSRTKWICQIKCLFLKPASFVHQK